MIYYISQYKYFSSIEYDFLKYIEFKGKEHKVVYLEKSEIKTLFFFIKLYAVKKADSFFQKHFRPTRYFQNFDIVKLSKKNYYFSKFSAPTFVIFLSKTGIIISESIGHEELKKNISNILNIIGHKKLNSDQIKCEILENMKGTSKTIKVFKYERDKLHLNNNIIILKIMFEHLKQII